MYRPRVIPVLLLKENGLFKTKQFNNPAYIGDPINAVKIFNDAFADELIFLDINSTKKNVTINYDLLSKISEEAMMPFSYGGGLDNLEKIRKVFKCGTEKIILNSVCYQSIDLIKEVSQIYGNQAVVVSIDVRYENDKYTLYSHGGNTKQNISLEQHIINCENAGAGEFFINSIEKEGTKEGYDIKLYEIASKITTKPIIASGGAKNEDDMVDLIKRNIVSATAAGSMFVFMGRKNAVMINYPEPEDLLELFEY